MAHKKTPRRSTEWFGKADKDGFAHRSWLRNQGLPNHLFDGRPVIGIWQHLVRTAAVQRPHANPGRARQTWRLRSGRLPIGVPGDVHGEPVMRPTAMLFRNLASMDVEESIRANPLDGVVLLVGCDKTTPALLMGAASCDIPTIALSGGPMLNGYYKGETIGSGTLMWKMDAMVKSGEISLQHFLDARPPARARPAIA